MISLYRFGAREICGISTCETLKWCRHGHLTFKTSGVEFDEELGSARGLHYGLDALKLDVSLLRRLWQTYKETGDQDENGEWNKNKISVVYSIWDLNHLKWNPYLYPSWRQTERSPRPQRWQTQGNDRLSLYRLYSLSNKRWDILMSYIQKSAMCGWNSPLNHKLTPKGTFAALNSIKCV